MQVSRAREAHYQNPSFASHTGILLGILASSQRCRYHYRVNAWRCDRCSCGGSFEDDGTKGAAVMERTDRASTVLTWSAWLDSGNTRRVALEGTKGAAAADSEAGLLFVASESDDLSASSWVCLSTLMLSVCSIASTCSSSISSSSSGFSCVFDAVTSRFIAIDDLFTSDLSAAMSISIAFRSMPGAGGTSFPSSLRSPFSSFVDCFSISTSSLPVQFASLLHRDLGSRFASFRSISLYTFPIFLAIFSKSGVSPSCSSLCWHFLSARPISRIITRDVLRPTRAPSRSSLRR